MVSNAHVPGMLLHIGFGRDNLGNNFSILVRIIGGADLLQHSSLSLSDDEDEGWRIVIVLIFFFVAVVVNANVVNAYEKSRILIVVHATTATILLA
jgi:hypothetical protein